MIYEVLQQAPINIILNFYFELHILDDEINQHAWYDRVAPMRSWLMNINEVRDL